MLGYHFPWMIRASKTLAQFLEGYRGSQLRIADGTREQMAIAVRLFSAVLWESLRAAAGLFF